MTTYAELLASFRGAIKGRTPGDWKASRRHSTSLRFMITGNHDSHGGVGEYENVAQIHGIESSRLKANAEAIASIPDMERLIELQAKMIEEADEAFEYIASSLRSATDETLVAIRDICDENIALLDPQREIEG